MQEVEAKIGLQPKELDVVRARLTAAGATSEGVDEEENLLFDSNDGRLRKSGQGLRLRSFGGRDEVVLTYKGPTERDSAYKSREELEVRVGDVPAMRDILERLGFRATTRYAKQRERWHLGETEIALDRLAFGDYVEVEGTEAAINETLARLELNGRPHIRPGYAELARRAGLSMKP